MKSIGLPVSKVLKNKDYKIPQEIFKKLNAILINLTFKIPTFNFYYKKGDDFYHLI